MGTRGPAPKRTEQRLGHVTKAQKEAVNKVAVEGVVKAPDAPEELHPIARTWFESLKTSGQSQFFEPSDWAAALYVAEAMSRNLTSSRFSGQLFSSVWSALTDMLTTEAARRRSRLEVQRAIEEQQEEKPTKLDEYKKRLSG